MTAFNWSSAVQKFAGFGGEARTFHVPKTGLPFFDVLRLFGAIELFIGLQQSVAIRDHGNEWVVIANVREHMRKDIQETAEPLKKNLSKRDAKLIDETWVNQLVLSLAGESQWPIQPFRNVSSPLDNPDSALKDGVRATAAATYKGLETGSGEKTSVPFVDALLAYAGQERTENISGIYFLPVFEGNVDFAKVVSPLRLRVSLPNVICAQVLVLLSLKTSLFAEGYAEKLSAVAYNTNLDPRKKYNYSGIILIDSTALGSSQQASHEFVSHFYRTFQGIVRRAWLRGKSTPEAEDAFAHAYWLMQPKPPKHLSALIGSLERQKKSNKPCVIQEYLITTKERRNYVKEVFEMTYGNWKGDHEAVRKFARAVASGIYQSRMSDPKLKQEEKGKAWYDEVVMLRSASTAKAFFERAMILIEQGKRENQFIGSYDNSEDFDPSLLLQSVGNNRSDFETFRDLFRMYLVQESVPKKRE